MPIYVQHSICQRLLSGEVYDETRDTTRTPRKKSPELEHGPKDSITTTEEHVDWNAVGENGQALF